MAKTARVGGSGSRQKGVILSCAWYGGYTGKKRGGSDSLEGVGEFWSLGRSEEGCGRGKGGSSLSPGKE